MKLPRTAYLQTRVVKLRRFGIFLMMAAILIFLTSLTTTLADPNFVSARQIAGYEVVDRPCGAATGGQSDNTGALYIICHVGETVRAGNQIQIIGLDGLVRQVVNLPFTANDVAPSPGGQVLYVSKEEAGGGPRPIRRLVRQADNSYSVDPVWKLKYPGVVEEVEGRFIASDSSGNLYVASGKWTINNGLGKVLKYSMAADGTPTLVTSFGTKTNTLPAPSGYFYFLTGIAVSMDGNTIYTVEQDSGRIQRFDKITGSSDYNATPTLSWGDNYGGSCGYVKMDPINGDRILASPYDIGLDSTGAVYLTNTTCGTIEKYKVSINPSNVAHQGSLWVGTSADQIVRDINDKPHGLAVDSNGNVMVPQTGKFARHINNNPPPVPKLTSLTLQWGRGPGFTNKFPLPLNGLNEVVTISSSWGHGLALTRDGQVLAWGANGYGQLGNGSTTDSPNPVTLTGVADAVGNSTVAIATGRNHSLALLSNGLLRAWGRNNSGQLGNGSTVDSPTPVTVSGLTGHIAAIAVGEQHNLALMEDGTVWAWGANESGQLGNNSTVNSSVPVQVSVLGSSVLNNETKVSGITAGLWHNLALLPDGKVFAWGRGDSGQLGNNSYSNSLVPVLLTAIAGVTRVSAGATHSLALLNNGGVRAWGNNGAGQAGITAGFSSTPAAVSVSVSSPVVGIYAGYLHSLALQADGKVWAWGWNEQGQLGAASTDICQVNGSSNSCSRTPLQVDGLSNVRALAAGYQHSLALASAGLVSNGQDNGLGNTPGTLSNLIKLANIGPYKLITFDPALTSVTLGGGRLDELGPGVSIFGRCGTTTPPAQVTLYGNNTAPPVAGLVLNGGNTVTGLKITNFNSPQLKALSLNGNNHLSCVGAIR